MTVDFFPKHQSKSFSDPRQLITYSFNKVERTIEGVVVELENQVLIYEYRGKYIGTEFFISFSKDSVSYKLIKVDERTA
ncbi:MAG: hypothetical protein NVSMB63_16560 [Sediminibacterium sp.]